MADVGDRIADRFVLRALIASGGMGNVWRAYDETLRVEVALKQVRLDPTATDAERAKLIGRAEHEARNGARVRDAPNIVAVYDVVLDGGAPWLVMRLVEGRSLLDELAARTRLPVAEARTIAGGLLAALAEAHGKGIIHRDVKPANVMLAADGTVLLADFGIAKHHADTTQTTRAMLIGSLQYMSPERLDGEDVKAGDMFALGVTLYEVVEGVSPFHRNTPTAVMAAIVRKDPEWPRHAGDLEGLIMALLQKDPEERPTVEAARQMLTAGLSGAANIPNVPSEPKVPNAPTKVIAPPGQTNSLAAVGLMPTTSSTPPTTSSSAGKSSGNDVLGGLGLILALVLLIWHQPIWNYVHDHFTHATPYDIKNIKEGQCFYAAPIGGASMPWAPIACSAKPPTGEEVWQVLRRFDDPTAQCNTTDVPGWNATSDGSWRPADKSYLLCSAVVNSGTVAAN
ncbi:serine/threonine protein kinase [Catenulispora sp. EB89]|uniref:serine/threonine-protein kinase n=1 Tax=Catenulispora sp. EB89 TaxID=3156257 RepID=UPI0035145FA2